MPVELEPDIAHRLARRLKGIKGFSWDEENIDATADDLRRWCRGAELNGEWWPPEKQAEWLVEQARDEWREWKGMAALRALLLSKFAPGPETLRLV